MRKRNILFGALLSGVLVAGVGAGVAVSEYMTLEVKPLAPEAGEAVVEELVYEMEPGELISIANPNCEIVFDESVPEGTVRMTVEYFPETAYIDYWADTYIQQGDAYSEEGQRVTFIQLYTYDGGTEMFLVQHKDEILDGLKNGKLLVPHSQFNNGDNSKKVVYLNPADEDRLDDGMLGEGDWVRVSPY